MNKKMKIIMIIILFIIVFILGIFAIKNLFFHKDLNYKIIDSGYISDLDEIIISNIKEYNSFMEDSNEWNKEYKKKLSSNNYNESFFIDKSLALKFILTGNGSTRLIDVDLSINGNNLIIRSNIYDPHTPQDDITGKLLVVEVPKNIINIE